VLVVVNKDASTVSILAADNGAMLATLPTGSGPHEVAASNDGRLAVVTNYGAREGGNSLTVVDLVTLAVARTIDLGEYRRPHGVVFLPDNRTVAVTSETSGVVLLVDVTSGRIIRTRSTGQDSATWSWWRRMDAEHSPPI
jgi:DNA-binding beta-propeller fold protein YncE